MTSSIERLSMTVDGVTHSLAPVEEEGAVKAAVLAAVRDGGGFVEFSVDAGNRLSVLVTRATSLTISAATVTVTVGTGDGGPAIWDLRTADVYDDDNPFDFL